MKDMSVGQLLLVLAPPRWDADTVTQLAHSHSSLSDAKPYLLPNLMIVRINHFILPRKVAAALRLNGWSCWGCSQDSANLDILRYPDGGGNKVIVSGDRNNHHLSGLVVEFQP